MELNNHLLHQENREQDTLDLDFMYQQIKKLGDKLDEYNAKTGNLQESNSMLKDFILEERRRGFLLFGNSELIVSVLDYDENSKKPLILEIRLLSPIVKNDNISSIEKIGFTINSVEIEKFIKEKLKNIQLLKTARRNNYTILGNNIVKKIPFKGGFNVIGFIKKEFSKLQLTLKETDLNTYTVSGENIEFLINIARHNLTIEGKLKDMGELIAIEYIMSEDIKELGVLNTESVKELGVLDTESVKYKVSTGIKKLFKFGGKEKKDKSISGVIGISDKKLQNSLQYINRNLSLISKLKTDLENNILDELDNFDNDIKDNIKNICIEYTKEILDLSEKLKINNPEQILYMVYLIRILLKAITERNLISFYQYILGKTELRIIYGESIKEKILESCEFESELLSKLFSVGEQDSLGPFVERVHDMKIIENSMQIASTTTQYGIKFYDISIGKEEESINNAHHYEQISKDGNKFIFTQKGIPFYLVENIKERKISNLNQIFHRDRHCDSKLYNEYILHIPRRGKYDIGINNEETEKETTLGINIYNNIYCVAQNMIFFLETSDNSNSLGLSYHSLSHGYTKSLRYLFNNSDRPMDIYSTDNYLYIVIKNKQDKLILRRVSIEDGNIVTDSIYDHDITYLNFVFQEKHIHISNDGYMILQDMKDIYIVNLNEKIDGDKLLDKDLSNQIFKTYKITPKEKFNHIFKVEFINSPEYGHFAICRTINHIYKIELGLIENLVLPMTIEEKNDNSEEVTIKELGTEEENQSYTELLAELEESKKRDATILEKLENSEKMNALILEQLETNKQSNANMLEEIKRLKTALLEKE